ncbi:DUF5686 and carboxypeptidase regulatory-like domain-containing protein [Mucilaginibacter sp. HMF5004]|uniref:DUF5686 family protein n=1 Tax=Mucilaginibacter rivuli TaxID=2857527 RepID=UPI001C60310F|nr:DUF5686 family protein [Mucilaginibacter rivuli]MBW4891247.1 DUF5686 and carboxypeptidase regulatory-like domain-containing protein [Mucilaginibacter rivuli]
MKKNLILFAFLLISVQVAAQQYLITGKVADLAGNAIPFTSVYVIGTSAGTSTNANGQYMLKLKPGKYQLSFRTLGFKQRLENIELSSQNKVVNVQLRVEQYKLNDANADSTGLALTIIKNAIAKREGYLNETLAYSCNVYIKGMQRLLHASQNVVSKAVSKQFDIDTTTNNILYMAEMQTQFNFEQPNRVKEIVISSKEAGVNNAFSFNRAANLQMNFYRNTFDIQGLSQRRLVSPIADDALNFYSYKLLGTSVENGKTIHKIQVLPKHIHGPIFNGYIYITDGDWRIYSVHLFVTKNANLNYVDTLNINQDYIQLSNDRWQPAAVAITYSGALVGFRYTGYIIGTFSDYNFDPKFPPKFFNGEIMRVPNHSRKEDSVYWAKNRPVPLTPEEVRNYRDKDAVTRIAETDVYQDSLERANNKFKPLRYMIFGDSIKNRAAGSSWFFHPSYETILFNNVEGFALDFKADYDKRIDRLKSYTISPELRYGFSNNLLSANVGFKYRYNPYTKAIFYGKAGSSVLDLNNEVNNSPFINSISTLFFESNTMKLYRSKYAMLGLQHNLFRGVLFDGSLEYAQREQLYNTTYFTVVDKPDVVLTSNNPFHPELPDNNLLFKTSNALTLKTSVTYTFDEQYVSTPNGFLYQPSRLPKIKLTYKKGIKNVLNSDIDYDYADLQVYDDHIKIGHVGYSSFTVTAGKFFNTNALVYPDYKKFKGNEGITFTPLVSYFHFLRYYTYTDDSFVEAHYEHNFSGFLMNKLKGIRHAKLEEIIGANYLGRANTPAYTEFYVGLKRYIFRVDYGISFLGGNHYMHGIMFYYGL